MLPYTYDKPLYYFMLKLPNKLSQLFGKGDKSKKDVLTTHESHDQGNHDDQEAKVKPRHPVASPNPYRRVSAKGLSLAVKPTVIGEAPIIDNENPTFYVIRDYSRSNSCLWV